MPRKLALPLLFLLGLAGAAEAGDSVELDREEGFRGLRFGAPIESVSDLRLVSESGARGSRLYVRPSEELVFGDASLDGVTYGFYAGRLYFVTLFTSGRRNARAALAELEREYGPGLPVPGQAEEYVWRGRRVWLHFRADPATSQGMVALTGVEMNARVERDRASSPADAAE